MPESSGRIALLEAARRNVDAAVRMLFGGEDPLSVHIVVAATFRVLHGLVEDGRAEARDDVMKLFLIHGGEPAFYRALDDAIALADQATQDPRAILQDVSEERNDFEIAVSCLYLECLEARSSTEAQAFLWWFATMYPHVMRADRFFKASLPPQDFQWLRGAPRPKQLQFGDTILRLARRNRLITQP
jgi:hypothetical protein